MEYGIHRSLTEGIVRVGSAAGIPATLSELGFNPDEILKECGIDPAIFDDPDNMISIAARSFLVQKCVEITACEHFGLLAGQKVDLSANGLIGYLAGSSINVGAALYNLTHYFYLLSQGSSMTLGVKDDSAFLKYTIYSADLPVIHQTENAAIAHYFNIMQQLCGKFWQPDEVRFRHAEPENVIPYNQLFQAPIRFNAGENGLYFPKNTLLHPLKDADPVLHSILQKQLDHIEADYRAGFPQQVMQILYTAFHLKKSSAEDVAALLSMNSRTLYRRLNECDTSFQEISDNCRFEIAKQMLLQSLTELDHIAELLNYADTRSFNRAFKRWSGITPSQWRLEYSPS